MQYILCTVFSSCSILITVVKCGEIHIKTKYNHCMLHKKQYEYVNIRICKHVTHKTCFTYINTLHVYDISDFNNIVFMFNANNNLLPDHMLSYFERVCDSHNHNTRNRNY